MRVFVVIVWSKIIELKYISSEMLLDLVNLEYKVGRVIKNMNGDVGSLMRILISVMSIASSTCHRQKIFFD